jgi:hypothetical protein
VNASGNSALRKRPKRKWLSVPVAAAVIGFLALSYLTLLKVCFSYYPIPISDPDLTRVTSPDGAFDAVLVCEGYGGGAGGIDWFVYILRKGESPTGPERAVFDASRMKGGKLIWRNPRPLEIHYDWAKVEQFQSVSSPGQTPNSESVQIRLVPSLVEP